jgi:hypothetical protein
VEVFTERIGLELDFGGVHNSTSSVRRPIFHRTGATSSEEFRSAGNQANVRRESCRPTTEPFAVVEHFARPARNSFRQAAEVKIDNGISSRESGAAERDLDRRPLQRLAHLRERVHGEDGIGRRRVYASESTVSPGMPLKCCRL